MTKITAVWDKENCDVQGMPISDLIANITSALKRCDPDFELSQLIAVGPRSRMPPDLPHHMVKYISLPNETILCQAEEKSESCFTYIVNDTFGDQVKTERTTDIADIIVVLEVFKHIYQTDGRNILIIGGDADFGCCLKKFAGENGFNIMLAFPKEGSDDIKSLTTHAWMWTSNDPEDGGNVMINGRGYIRNH